MAERSPERELIMAQFKAGMALVDFAVNSVSDEKDAEELFRGLDQRSYKLVPKFRKGNDLSHMLYTNRLRRNER